MPQLVEVRFKGNRKAYFEWSESEPLRLAEPVVVESERGVDFGVVSATGQVAQTKCDRCQGCALGGGGEPEKGRERGRDRDRETSRRPVEPTRRVVRRATRADRRTHEDLRGQEDDVRRRAREKTAQLGLAMKVSDAEWQWDRNKLTIYFTAEKRVDFRQLVRDLAAAFRTRIELRQIGVRDEAARIGGIGRCGRELCSASWLPELRPIGLHVARDQRLSLNPSQISGACGRLLCCLRYEHEFYVQSRKRFPKEGKVLQTSKGLEKVWSVDIFRDQVTVRAEDGTSRTVPLADLKDEVARAGAGAGPGAASGGGTGSVAASPGPSAPARQPRERGGRPGPRPAARPALESGAPAAEPAAAGAREPATPEGADAAGAAGAGPRRKRRRRRRRGKGGPPGPPGGEGGSGGEGGGA